MHIFIKVKKKKMHTRAIKQIVRIFILLRASCHVTEPCLNLLSSPAEVLNTPSLISPLTK